MKLGGWDYQFENMRRRLREQLAGQETLLEISYAISASLDLHRAIPPISNCGLGIYGRDRRARGVEA